MKKIIITLLIVFSIQTIKAQKKSEFELITSGKWHIEYMEMKGKKMTLPPEIQQNNWVIFHADGKQEGMENGQKYTGKWKYDKEKRIIKTNDIDGIVEQKLISVTKDKLIISVTEQGAEMIMGMKK